MNYIEEAMIEYEADGVDFVPLKLDYNEPYEIIESYTREEWKDVKYFPKTTWFLWKIVDGKKVYINNIQLPIEKDYPEILEIFEKLKKCIGERNETLGKNK